MTELVFVVEDDPDGGLTARAVGESIFVEADSVEELRREIEDAMACHFANPGDRPKAVLAL